MLAEATLDDWKRLMEVFRRELAGPYSWHIVVCDDDVCREYRDGEEVVASMLVVGSNTDKLGQDCERVYRVREDLLGLARALPWPSPEDWEHVRLLEDELDDLEAAQAFYESWGFV